MTAQLGDDVNGNYTGIARRWLTQGWTGDTALAADIFSEHVTTNGIPVGVAGPTGRIRDRLTGFPDLSTTIDELFQAGNTVVTRLTWRGTHTGPYGGVEPTGKPVEIRDMALDYTVW